MGRLTPPVRRLLAAVTLAVCAACASCGGGSGGSGAAASPTGPTATTGQSTAAPSLSPTPGESTSAIPSGPPWPSRVVNGPLRVRPAGGDRAATRADYDWVVEGTPAEEYTVAVLQGLTPREAVATLGPSVRLDDDLTGLGALQYVEAHLGTPPVPCVVQADRIGPSVVLYEPRGALVARRVTALAAHGPAAYFRTDEDWDTKIQVADHGSVLRTLDPFATYTNSTRDRLPQERGLRIGHGAPFAVSWALLERVLLTHISQDWLVTTEHPTYLVQGEGCARLPD